MPLCGGGAAGLCVSVPHSHTGPRPVRKVFPVTAGCCCGKTSMLLKQAPQQLDTSNPHCCCSKCWNRHILEHVPHAGNVMLITAMYRHAHHREVQLRCWKNVAQFVLHLQQRNAGFSICTFVYCTCHCMIVYPLPFGMHARLCCACW